MSMKLCSSRFWSFAADQRGFLSIEIPTLTASLIVAIGIITGLIIGFAPTARDALGSHFVAEANAYAEGCDRKCRKRKRKEAKQPLDWNDVCSAVARPFNGGPFGGRGRCGDQPNAPSYWDGLTPKQQKQIRDWLNDKSMAPHSLDDYGNVGSQRHWDFDPSTGERRCLNNGVSPCWWQS